MSTKMSKMYEWRLAGETVYFQEIDDEQAFVDFFTKKGGTPRKAVLTLAEQDAFIGWLKHERELGGLRELSEEEVVADTLMEQAYTWLGSVQIRPLDKSPKVSVSTTQTPNEIRCTVNMEARDSDV